MPSGKLRADQQSAVMVYGLENRALAVAGLDRVGGGSIAGSCTMGGHRTGNGGLTGNRGSGTNNCYQSNPLVLDRTAVSESDMPSGLFDELNV
jgi:hypothetical protein